ncbi:hypothetical protein LSH36_291g03052 [Paralvinella palmiformis]|uniref:Uncharacterized protein n=1 Tax=Paralvinella palmiformis TaxID=53620 RepID=A0AAD9N1U2_9ANNE|nr:hypothetical protein LSH36_291g03052 [Paralvinella palmiformis]
MSGRKEILRCNICLETMKDERMLPSCGHMFCLQCLEEFVGHKIEIQCPVCRDKCRVPTAGVRSFPRNIYLKQFLDQLCAECEKYPRTEKCPHCGQTLCAQCRDGHVEALRNELSQIVCRVETLNDVKAAKDSKKEKKSLVDMQKSVEKEIAKAADDFVKLIRSQERKLKSQLKSCVNADVKDIDGRLNHYQDGIATLKQFTRKYDLRNMSDEQLIDMKNKWHDHYGVIEQTLNDNMTACQKDVTCQVDAIEVDKAVANSWKLATRDGGEVSLDSHRLSVSSFGLPPESPKPSVELVLLKDKPSCVFGGSGVAKGKLQSPFGVTFCATTNQIVLSDTHNHRIQIFELNGQPAAIFGSQSSPIGPLKHPVGIACMANGGYIIADAENHRVVMADKEGKFLRAFGKQGSGVNDFNQPWGVAADSTDRNIYITDCGNNRIQVVNIYGRYIRTIGRVELKSPTGIVIDGNDDVYVADCDNHRIVVYSKYGTKRRAFGWEGSKQGQLSSPCDVAIDVQGNVVVAEWGNHRVQVFTKEGQSIRMFGRKGTAEGEFTEPRSVTVTADNNIVVCDCGNNRVQIF